MTPERLGKVKDNALDMAKEKGCEKLQELADEAKKAGKDAVKLGADKITIRTIL